MRKNKSAIKKAKQSEEKRIRNAHVKSTMKTDIKKALSAVEASDKNNAPALLKNAVASINRAASQKVIHKNNAARKVSRLSKKADKALAAKS
ncbi:MAG TPA: 30S ribosomal protein S20 [Syntrophorhabdaceae bacterium]|nr:30S ribosomal protein S20 [Syntrophorhabdaceae bacterium]